MGKKSTRRSFLTGKSLLDSSRDAAARAFDSGGLAGEGDFLPPSADSLPRKGLLSQISREAMACEFEVSLNAGQYERGTHAALDALDLVDRVEEKLSVFRDSSLVSRINREAASRPVEVDPWVFALFQECRRLHDETGGAFDITSGPLWKTWGFARRQGTMPSGEAIDEALRKVGMEQFQLDESTLTVSFHQPGMEINLGSIGKGFALDRASEHLMSEGVKDYLLHGGGSSVIARGNQSGESWLPESSSEPESSDSETPPPKSLAGWNVGMLHPMRHGRRMAEIRLGDQSLSTSGSQRQFFRHAGKRYSHILDPKTGFPAEGVLSVTVLAPTATLSDALATAFFVMGPKRTETFCRLHPQIGAVFLLPARKAGGFERHLVNFPEERFRLMSDW